MNLGDNTITIPEQIINNKTPILDQSLPNNPSTKYACTRYGTTKAINENNAIEWSNIIIDPVKERIIALEEYDAIVDKGASLRSAVEQARNRKLIAWYAVCTDEYQMKYAIASGQMLFTWTTQCDWKKTRETGVFHTWNSYWHAFWADWYTKEWLLCFNSYWNKYEYNGMKWYFLVRREDIKYLFTVYALIDFENLDELQKEKIRRDEESKQRMFDAGIWNGERPNDPVTREETVLMLDRLYQKIQKDNS